MKIIFLLASLLSIGLAEVAVPENEEHYCPQGGSCQRSGEAGIVTSPNDEKMGTVTFYSTLTATTTEYATNTMTFCITTTSTVSMTTTICPEIMTPTTKVAPISPKTPCASSSSTNKGDPPTMVHQNADVGMAREWTWDQRRRTWVWRPRRPRRRTSDRRRTSSRRRTSDRHHRTGRRRT